MRLLPRLALLVFLAGCGGATPSRGASAPPPEPPPPEPPPRASGDAPPSAPASPRSLAAGASFEDLVAAARALDDRRDQESDAGCLVAREPGGAFALRADLAVAVRPLPAPAADLDTRLETDAGPVRVLTRYGSYGGAPAELGLVAVTTTLPPTRGVALVLFLTNEGLYARRSDRPGGERDASRVAWVLEHAEWSDVDLVAVSAEAGVPLERVVELLASLPASLAGRVTLAVPLAEGTRLPDAPPVAAGTSEGGELCPEGLPELTEDAPLGELGAADIRAALAPLRADAELCVGTSTGPGAAGGRVGLAVRIAPDGRVADACVTEDSAGDAELRACLSRAARGLVFSAPGGYVDFVVPLALEPGRAQRQVPVCP